MVFGDFFGGLYCLINELFCLYFIFFFDLIVILLFFLVCIVYGLFLKFVFSLLDVFVFFSKIRFLGIIGFLVVFCLLLVCFLWVNL